MARILRGEIHWADLNPTRGREQAGQRPVLILSNDIFNERSGTVIAVALTSQPQRAGFPLTLELRPAAGWLRRHRPAPGIPGQYLQHANPQRSRG
jgi:mRNA interferase MazF